MECKHNRFKGFILCADCNKLKTDQILDTINNLKDENNLLKFQLQELHQANVNLHNENEKLKKELKLHKEQQAFNFSSLNDTVNRIIELKELVEIKEIINKDLSKKYEKLEQDYNDSIERFEMKSSTLNNLCKFTEDLQTKYEQLEQDYNDLSKNMVQGLKVTLQHRVKPYLGSGVVNVIIETKEDFK